MKSHYPLREMKSLVLSVPPIQVKQLYLKLSIERLILLLAQKWLGKFPLMEKM